jgi:hypothetical protein
VDRRFAMGSPQAIGALTLGGVVMFMAPSLVWATAIAGLIQIVREKVRESRAAQIEATQEAQELIGSN